MSATQGWTSSPNGRGTYDIILSCLVTIFLCCWTSVYPNIGAVTDKKWTRLRDKLGLALLGIIGPDFLITLAIGQLCSARRSLKKFHEAGFKDWTLTHAFFADMGGFVLKAPGLQQPIPLDAEQLFYLIRHEYVEPPAILKEELDDRDKSDGLSRLFAIMQALWFILSLIARAAQNLRVTTIEITTISFIIILLGTAWCWKDKPSDVTTTICLETSVSVDHILAEGGIRAAQPYYHTPLDFISRYEDPLNLLWDFYNECLRRVLKFSPISRPVGTVPWNRIPGDRFLKIDFGLTPLNLLFILAFSSIFFIGWDFYFPSATERLLWRIASIYIITFGAIGSIVIELWIFVFLPRFRETEGYELSLFEESLKEEPFPSWYTRILGRGKDSSCAPISGSAETQRLYEFTEKLTPGPVGRFLSRTLNMSHDRDPHMNIPVGLLLPATILCLLYLLCRAYILTEDFVGLRSQPSEIYDTVSWLSFLPHV